MTTAGDVLVQLALVSSILAIGGNIYAARAAAKRPWARNIGLAMSVLSLVLTLLVWAVMTNHFVSNDLDMEYVHQHTSTDLETPYKISGVWAGREGSFLLWTVGMQVGLVAASLLRRRSGAGAGGRGKGSGRVKGTGPVEDRLLDATSIVGAIMVTIFLTALLSMDPFRATDSVALVEHPDGLGLNVLLQHPLMAIHPMLALLGYGIATVPFVASVSYMLTGERIWAVYSIPFSRLFLLMFTVALTMGGLWAYTTVGWGGYWAWDPVETSSLLPWLMAVVICHAQVSYVKRGRSGLLAATASYFILPVILFATFSARSGLWSSVHAYAATQGDFWEVVSASGMLSGLLAMIVLLAVLGPLLIARAYISFPDGEEGERGTRRAGRGRWPRMTRNWGLLTANILVLMGVIIIVLIMLQRVGGPLDPGEFESKLAPFALVAVGAMMLFHFGIRRPGAFPFVALAIGIAGGIAALSIAPGRPLAAVSIPFLAAAVVGVFHYIWRARRTRRPRARLHDAGASLIHLGVLLLLLGYTGSTFYTNEETVTLSEDTAVHFEDYDLVLVDLDEGEGRAFVTVEVYKDGSLLGAARPGIRVIHGQMRSEVSVVRLLDKDLRFVLVYGAHLETGEGARAQVTVESLPCMNMLWGGAVMVATGTALRFAWTPQRYTWRHYRWTALKRGDREEE